MQDCVEIKPVSEVFATAWQEISQRTGKPEIEIPFLQTLSEKIWGLKRKELLVVGARTSQGKSGFALQLAYHCAKQGFRTYFFSLEMGAEALTERLFCQVAMIPNHELLTKPQEYKQKAKEFKELLEGLPLVITYKIGSTIKDLYEVIEDLPKPDVVILDYIQGIKHFQSDRLPLINEYILSFRELAVKKNFVGIMASQINREAMEAGNKMPQLWMLKSTGTLEEHADTVLLLHWNYSYSGNLNEINNYEVIIAKNRNGMTGTIKAHFEPQCYLISEANNTPY
jgi:replicative DNA helicase